MNDTKHSNVNEEDQRVIDDPNASESEKQAAADHRAERIEEMETLAPQIQQREETLHLHERVKRIFKKYGWTLQAVVLATGLVLGAVAHAAMNGLKAGTKAVEKGLKTIGQKLGWLKRRDKDTLLPIKRTHILPGTRVMNDKWKAYDCLQEKGY